MSGDWWGFEDRIVAGHYWFVWLLLMIMELKVGLLAWVRFGVEDREISDHH
jgi:hypothetical protein